MSRSGEIPALSSGDHTPWAFGAGVSVPKKWNTRLCGGAPIGTEQLVYGPGAGHVLGAYRLRRATLVMELLGCFLEAPASGAPGGPPLARPPRNTSWCTACAVPWAQLPRRILRDHSLGASIDTRNGRMLPSVICHRTSMPTRIQPPRTLRMDDHLNGEACSSADRFCVAQDGHSQCREDACRYKTTSPHSRVSICFKLSAGKPLRDKVCRNLWKWRSQLMKYCACGK